MHCKNCDNEIPINSTVCPYCGKEINNGNSYAIKTGKNELAIIGLIFAIIMPLFGFIISICGLVESKHYKDHNGRTISIIGIVISLIPVFFIILLLFLSFGIMIGLGG